MAYSIKFRKKVLNEIFNGMSVSEASSKYNVSEQAIRDWRNNPEKFLQEPLRPVQLEEAVKDEKSEKGYAPKRQFNLKEKVEILHQAEMNVRSVREIARINNINNSTLRTWIKNKKQILALYLSQEHSDTAQQSERRPEKENETMALPKDSISIKAENKALKDKVDYLESKVAYLEKLLELTGTPSSKCKKKLDTELLKLSAKKENGQ